MRQSDRWVGARLCVWAVLVIVVLPTACLARTKFTQEELAMTAPDWCPNADAMALNAKSDYYADPFSGISGSHSLRIKILTEKGKESGSLDLICPYGYKLWDINARTITPAGRAVKVKSSQIFPTTLYTGREHDIKRTVYRIAFPEVTVGAILECEYQTFTKNLTFVPPHYFDVNGLPTLQSELIFTLPEGAIYQLTPVNMGKFAFTEKKEPGINTDGTRQLIYTATVSKIRTDADAPYSPADDFLRPHMYFVFARFHVMNINIPFAPDWETVVGLVSDEFEAFQHKAKKLPALLQSLSADTGSSRAERLYRWVTDSIEYTNSRQWTDYDGTVDERLAARKASGIEKALILQSLYKLAGISSTILLMVPENSGPTLTRLPTLAQFETFLMRVTVNGTTLFVDPSQEGTRFGHYSWSLAGVQALQIDKENPDFITVPPRKEINRMSWRLTCAVDTAGTLTASGTLLLTNQSAHRCRARLKSLDSTALKEYVATNFLTECAAANIQRVSLPMEKWTDSACAIDLTWQIANYAERSGEDWLIKPNCVKRIGMDFLP